MITCKVVGFIANCHQSILEANQHFDTYQEEGSLFQDMFANPSENFSGLANKSLSTKGNDKQNCNMLTDPAVKLSLDKTVGLPLDSRGVFFIDRDGALFRWTKIRLASDLI